MSNWLSKFTCSLTAGALVWNLGVSTCFAHPDHPIQVGASDSWLHYFIQPEHSLPLAVFAAAMWWLSRMVKPILMARVPSKKIVQVEDRR